MLYQNIKKVQQIEHSNKLWVTIGLIFCLNIVQHFVNISDLKACVILTGDGVGLSFSGLAIGLNICADILVIQVYQSG